MSIYIFSYSSNRPTVRYPSGGRESFTICGREPKMNGGLPRVRGNRAVCC